MLIGLVSVICSALSWCVPCFMEIGRHAFMMCGRLSIEPAGRWSGADCSERCLAPVCARGNAICQLCELGRRALAACRRNRPL